MTILQQQIDFLHSGGLLFYRPFNNGMVVLREDFDLIILVENTLDVVDVGQRIFGSMLQLLFNEFHSDTLLQSMRTVGTNEV